ncbi:MAG: putative major facilitator superfamily 1 [Nitrososphaeraceae archaeon]|jgi:MFS family permease|nr:putative major facilitator superfamily 1 [Nitrososphaeraceae archaeon]MDF2768680.1 putative major facilitator superfamily 1 [Nitrososphaeraceae archaeon]
MAVSLISLIVMMGATMVTPSLTLYAKEGFSDNGFIIGAIVAGYAIGRVITDIPSGFLTDRIGISKTMKIGLGIQIVSSIFAGIAPNYWILFLMRVTEGIGSSIYVNAAVTYVLLSNQSSRRGTVMGIYQSIMMTGITIGPMFGAFIASTYGLNASYFAYAAVLVVAMIIVFFIQHKGKFHLITNGADNNYNLDSESFGIIRNISIYINSASLATFGFAFLRSGIYTMAIPLFAYENLHLSVVSVGFIFTLASVANLFASFFSGKLTDRYGMKWPLIISILVASFIIIIIPFTTLMIQMLILVIILGITSGFFGQSVAWAAEKVEEKVKKSINTNNKNSSYLRTSSFVTKGIGFNRMIGDAGLILGPLIVGYIIMIMKNQNFVWVVSFVTVSVVLMSICSLLTKANNSRNMIFTKV